MNHLEGLRTLKNRYFALRHGESTANVKGIIVSDPKIGVPWYGLSKRGIKRVREQAMEKSEVLALDGQEWIRFWASDFRRAHQTATIWAREIEGAVILPEKRLRERYFGRFEGTTNHNYQRIWNEDAKDATHTRWDVESAEHVLTRTTKHVADLERCHHGQKFVLVSHGDALQILQTAFARIPPSQHRSLPHLEPGELRELVLA